MLGIPTVATDNTHGKLRGTFDTFTHAAPLADWADTPAEALTLARAPARIHPMTGEPDYSRTMTGEPD